MRRVILLLYVLIFILTGCNNSISEMKGFHSQKVTESLEDALKESVIDSKGTVIRNAAICVEFPRENYKYVGAKGIARKDTQEEMTAEHQFFISSVGKAVTAGIIMQLYEEGSFGANGLDATLNELDLFPPEVLTILHMKDGISYGGNITVRQLLNHTTGLKNVDNDSENDLGDNHPESMGYAPGSLNYIDVYDKTKGVDAALKFIHEGMPKDGKLSDYYLFQPLPEWDYDAWLKNPHDKMAGQLNFFLDGANKNALFKPGEGMYYSDTNYLVLGLLIEKVTGKSLDEAKNERIFKPLGMKHTYLSDSIAAQERKYKLSDYWANNEPLVSLGINLSRTDRGDGAEITTLADLNTFIRELARGRLFRNPSTLTEMLKLPFDGDFGYADGIIYAKTDSGDMLSHNGSSGAWMEYYSKYDLSIVGTVNEINTERMMKLRAGVFQALRKGGLESSTFRYGPSLINLLFTVENPSSIVPLIMLSGSIIVFLSAILVWPLVTLFKRKRKYAGNDGRESYKKSFIWLAVINSLLNITFLIALIADGSNHSDQILITGYTSFLKVLLQLPTISLVLSIIMVIASAAIWKSRYWRTGKCMYYSIITIASISFLGSLRLLNLLFLPIV